MTRLEELEKQAKDILEEIEKIKRGEKSNTWKPSNGDVYYYIDSNGYSIDNTPFEDTVKDMMEDYDMGNCFPTESKAEEMVEKVRIYMQLKRLAEEINTEPIDWNNSDQTKISIDYDFEEECLTFGNAYVCKSFGTIYSTNKDFMEIAIEKIGSKELEKLFK